MGIGAFGRLLFGTLASVGAQLGRPGVLSLSLMEENSLGGRLDGAAIGVDLLVLRDVRYLRLGLRQQPLRLLQHLIPDPLSHILPELVQIALARQFVLLGQLRYVIHLALQVPAHLVEEVFLMDFALLTLLLVHFLLPQQGGAQPLVELLLVLDLPLSLGQQLRLPLLVLSLLLLLGQVLEVPRRQLLHSFFVDRLLLAGSQPREQNLLLGGLVVHLGGLPLALLRGCVAHSVLGVGAPLGSREHAWGARVVAAVGAVLEVLVGRQIVGNEVQVGGGIHPKVALADVLTLPRQQVGLHPTLELGLHHLPPQLGELLLRLGLPRLALGRSPLLVQVIVSRFGLEATFGVEVALVVIPQILR